MSPSAESSAQPSPIPHVESPMRPLPLFVVAAAALIHAQPTPADSPRPSAGHVLVAAKAFGGVLLLNGETEGAARIWLRKGSAWIDLGPLGTPPRSLPACAYDPMRKMVVVHGGAIASPNADGGNDWKVDGQTLGWDGKTWRVLSATGPSPRDHHAMVYDAARKKIVLYGGGDADPSGRSVYFSDTWEWDGKAWTRVAEAGPGPRVHHAMGYDPVRRRTVLVGGYGPGGADGRTWEWNGKTWQDMGQSEVALRVSPRIVFDTGRKKLVLFGGDIKDNLPSDTYEWDGVRWSRIAEQGPPGRTVHALAFDETRKVLVLFGGAGPDPLADTWVLGTSPEGPVWKQVP